MAPSNPTLSQDLGRIHRVITRALNIAIVNGIEYLQTGFPSPRVMQGYIRFNRCLLSMICSHHQAEDKVAFPAFRRLLPLAPYAQLGAEHRQFEALMALIPDLLTDIRGDAPEYGLRVLIMILRKISRLWAPHIALEEKYFSREAFSADTDGQIQLEISSVVNNARFDHAKPPYWMVPFLLFQLEPSGEISRLRKPASLALDELLPTYLKHQRRTLKQNLHN
jgi:Hemerythrin HHE cation binding domain